MIYVNKNVPIKYYMLICFALLLIPSWVPCLQLAVYQRGIAYTPGSWQCHRHDWPRHPSKTQALAKIAAKAILDSIFL